MRAPNKRSSLAVGRGTSTASLDASQRDAAARAIFLRMSPRKWAVVRLFESALRFLMLLLPSPQVVDDLAARPAAILVVEYWNLGDLAILVPFLRHLRRTYPDARITLLVNEKLSSFLANQGLVDEFIAVSVPWAQFNRLRKYNPFSREWIRLVRVLVSLRRHQFDWALSGRMDVRDNLLLWLSGARRRIGYGFAGGGFLLTDRVAPDLSRPHRADAWLHLLGFPDDDIKIGSFRLRFTEVEQARADSFLVDAGVPPNAMLVGVHPGARIAARRWGDDNFAAVVNRILADSNVHVVWFSDPTIAVPGPRIERCHTACLEFGAFLALVSRCRFLICNDSGPMQVASLLGVPVVALIGPTNPVWFGPRGAEDRIVIRPEFWCRPCFDYCIFDQPYCIREISVDQVYEVVEEVIRHNRVEDRETHHLANL